MHYEQLRYASAAMVRQRESARLGASRADRLSAVMAMAWIVMLAWDKKAVVASVVVLSASWGSLLTLTDGDVLVVVTWTPGGRAP